MTSYTWSSSSVSPTVSANATTTTPATVGNTTAPPSTVPTAAAGELVADGSLMGLVLFCVMGVFLL